MDEWRSPPSQETDNDNMEKQNGEEGKGGWVCDTTWRGHCHLS